MNYKQDYIKSHFENADFPNIFNHHIILSITKFIQNKYVSHQMQNHVLKLSRFVS